MQVHQGVSYQDYFFYSAVLASAVVLVTAAVALRHFCVFQASENKDVVVRSRNITVINSDFRENIEAGTELVKSIFKENVVDVDKKTESLEKIALDSSWIVLDPKDYQNAEAKKVI